MIPIFPVYFDIRNYVFNPHGDFVRCCKIESGFRLNSGNDALFFRKNQRVEKLADECIKQPTKLLFILNAPLGLDIHIYIYILANRPLLGNSPRAWGLSIIDFTTCILHMNSNWRQNLCRPRQNPVAGQSSTHQLFILSLRRWQHSQICPVAFGKVLSGLHSEVCLLALSPRRRRCSSGALLLLVLTTRYNIIAAGDGYGGRAVQS